MLNNVRNFHGDGPYFRCGCCNPVAKKTKGVGRQWVKKWRRDETQRARRAEERAWREEMDDLKDWDNPTNFEDEGDYGYMNHLESSLWALDELVEEQNQIIMRLKQALNDAGVPMNIVELIAAGS